MDNKAFFTMRELAGEMEVSVETIKGWRKKRKIVCKYITFIERKPIMTAENYRRFISNLPSVAEESSSKSGGV